MKRKTLVDWIFEGLIITLCAASFLVMAQGVYQQEWWAGLGLVIFMTSLLCWFSVVFSQEVEIKISVKS